MKCFLLNFYCGKINIKCIIFTLLNVHFSGIKYIHMMYSPPHYPSLDLFHHPKPKLCTHSTLTPPQPQLIPPYPHPW